MAAQPSCPTARGGLHLTPEQLVEVVMRVCLERVKQHGQVHPEDVMTTVTLTTETIYQFVTHLPR